MYGEELINSPTSTAAERIALNAPVNLSDGHARILADTSISAAFENAHEYLHRAAQSPQSKLEREFATAFEMLYDINFPRRPLFSYSASSLAGIIGTFLGRGAKATWPIPSFDNLRDLVKSTGVEIDLVPENIIFQLLSDETKKLHCDAIWLTLPNNPTGLVLAASDYSRLTNIAAKTGVLLVIDHCFRAYSDQMLAFDQYEILEASGCKYVVLEDTGKTISTLDLKVGLMICSIDIYRDLELLNENLILNVSPFTLIMLTTIMTSWHATAGLVALRSVIDTNREIIRQAYASSQLRRQMHSTAVPLEWLDVGSKDAATELLNSCEVHGLQLLPGGSFFGSSNTTGSRYLRIALAKDTSTVVAAANILQDVLASSSS